MLEFLQHLQLVVHHLFIALDIALQDNLDSDLARGAVSLTDDAIGTSAEGSTESVEGPGLEGDRLEIYNRARWVGVGRREDNLMAYFLS